MRLTSVNSLSARADGSLLNTKSGLSIPVIILAMLLPGFVMAQTTYDSSLEILLRIGMDDGRGNLPGNHERSRQDNTIEVLDSRILKRPARYLRRVQFSESHIAIEGVDKQNNVVYQDSLIDPRLIRSEATKNTRLFQRTDFYRAAANLNVVLPNDPRIVELRLSLPRWNGMNFDLESMVVIPVRKMR